MSGNKILVDTNVIVWLGEGHPEVARSMEGKDVYLSIITYMELLGNPNIDAAYEKWVRTIISDATVIELDSAITEAAILIRRHRRLKLPDAIIAGTAQVFDLPVVTFDKNFESLSELNVMLLK